MANPPIRGVRAADEHAPTFQRDVRRLGQLFRDGLADPLTTSISLAGLALVVVFFPTFAHIWPFLALTVLGPHFTHRRHRHLPIRLPYSANIVDINSPQPGRRRYHTARGMIYVGNAYEHGNQEVWLSRDDACTHGLMLATTGSGKSVALTGESANYLAVGGGLIYSDAKASPGLAFDIAGICRRMGREDDLLLINYMTGNRSVAANGSGFRLTNTANPLASGSADSLVQIMSSLIPAPEGDNAVFGERALTMMTAVLYGLVDLRDGGFIDLGVSTLRDYLPIERIESLAFDPRLRTETAKNALMAYMRSLPNWKPPAERQAVHPRTGEPLLDADGQPKLDPIHEEAGRQHGFSQMYFTRALSSLTDTYGHIFFGVLGEVDYGDVVRNRRVLVIMLPATEKSLSELQNLGKINLSAIRDAVSAGLGSSIEGSKAEVVDTLTAGAKIPNKIILDEAGYQSSPGFAVIAAQARSLLGGFSVIWAGQTWASIKRGSESEADEIWGNANIKYFGRLSDNESYSRLEALVGEAKVTSTSGYAIQPDSLTGGYADTLQASVERSKRVDFLDLQQQTEGEFHIVFGGSLIRVRSFYADLSATPEFRINRFLRVGEKLAITEAPVAVATPPVAPQGRSDAAERAPRPERPAMEPAMPQTVREQPFTPSPKPLPIELPPGLDAVPSAQSTKPKGRGIKDLLASIEAEGNNTPDVSDDMLPLLDAPAPAMDSRLAPGFSEFADDLQERYGIVIERAHGEDEDDDMLLADVPDDDDLIEALLDPETPQREHLHHLVDTVVDAYPSDAVVQAMQSTDAAAEVLNAMQTLLRDLGENIDEQPE